MYIYAQYRPAGGNTAHHYYMLVILIPELRGTVETEITKT